MKKVHQALQPAGPPAPRSHLCRAGNPLSVLRPMPPVHGRAEQSCQREYIRDIIEGAGAGRQGCAGQNPSHS